MSSSLAAMLVAAAVPALACCGTPDARDGADGKPAASSADRTKVEAPVEIAATLGERTARVTVRFTSPAEGVRVDVSGVDGLAVTTAPTLVEGASYARGAEASFDLEFTLGPGRSHLVVAVSGTFGGGRRAKVRSFAVGTSASRPPGEKGRLTGAQDGGGRGGENGERVKVVVPRP